MLPPLDRDCKMPPVAAACSGDGIGVASSIEKSAPELRCTARGVVSSNGNAPPPERDLPGSFGAPASSLEAEERRRWGCGDKSRGESSGSVSEIELTEEALRREATASGVRGVSSGLLTFSSWGRGALGTLKEDCGERPT